MIYLGSNTVNYLWLGSNPVDAAWLGSNPVYPYSVGNAYIAPTSLNFPYTSGTSTLNVYDPQNHGWTITGYGWVSLSRYSGTGNATITVSVSSNPTAAQRSVSMTFSDNVTSATTTVNVIQAATPAPSAVYLTITPGTYTVRVSNFYELDWTVSWDRDQVDVIASDVYAGPTYSGDTITWGYNDLRQLIPTSEYGTTKRVYYELVGFTIDGDFLFQDSNTAEVTIPSAPVNTEYSIQLPNL